MRKFLLLTALVVGLFTAAIAQTRPIKGKVIDKDGKPIPGASINLKGHQGGTAAESDGSFNLSVKSGDVLIISALNFATTQVKVGNQTSISVILESTDAVMGEVVVTTGFGVQKQTKEIGYSTATVQAKDLIVAKPVSVANGLTGKVSGLQINTTNNGLFADTRITLRGNRSLTGNNQPLVVVDGAIFYNDISTLNPDDISQINVLKGASASAIYGSDASNGVLLITTKRGSKGTKSTISVSSTVQAEQLAYMPKFQNEFGSNGGEKFVNDFNDLSAYIPYENQSYGPRFNGKIVPVGRPVADGSVLMVPYSARPNERNNFFNTGITSQNNISFSSGDEASKFFLSFQDVYSKSIMPGDFGKRDIVRIGGAKKYGIFSADYSVSYTLKTKNTTNTGLVYQLVMNTPAHVPLTSLKDWRNNKFADVNGFYNDYFDNPYWVIDNQRNITTDNNLTANVKLDLKPTKWLNVSYRLALTNLNRKFEYKSAPKNYSNFALTNSDVIYANAGGTGYDTVSESAKYIAAQAGKAGIAASYAQSSKTNYLLTSDFLISADKNVGKDFNVKATIGTSYIENKINYASIAAPSLVLPVYNIKNVSGLTDISDANGYGGNGYYEANKFGVFAEGTGSYKNLVFLHGSYRGDIDSRLSEANRFIPYYDVDASFILSDIFPTISKNDVLNYAKIRAAHSVTGNASALSDGSEYIADGAYQTKTPYFVATGFPFGNVGGYAYGNVLLSDKIKPETITENEVGLELGLFKNKLNLTMAAYQSELTDGIVKANTSTSSGFYQSKVNAAHTKNTGIELELKAELVKTSTLTWNLNFNYTHNISKVVSINGGLKQITVGKDNVNAFAVVDNAYPIIQTRDWVRDAQGRVVVDAITGNPSRDPNLKIVGQASPKDIFGFTSNLTYKAFTFTITADYRSGHKIFNFIGNYMDFTGISQTSASTHRQRFVFPNSVTVDASGKSTPNTNIMVDDANFNFWPGLYRSVGTNYITSAEAFKLREIAIAYQLPQSLIKKTKVLQSATFTVSGRNLLMITPKSNIWTDPEFSEGTGNDIGRTSENQSPPSRIFSASLALTF